MATGGRGRRDGRGPRCSSARDNARAAATATPTPMWYRTSLRAASRPPHVPHYSSALSTERGVVRRPPALALPAPQSRGDVPIACDSLAHQAARETLTQLMGRGKGRCVDPWTDHQTRSCATDPGLFDDFFGQCKPAGARLGRRWLVRRRGARGSSWPGGRRTSWTLLHNNSKPLRVRGARGSAAGSVGSDSFGRDTFKNVTRLVEAAGMRAWWRKPRQNPP